MTSGAPARRLTVIALGTGQRQTEHAGGVSGKDQAQGVLAEAEFPAGLELNLEIPAREPPRKPSRVGAEDDPLRPHGLEELSKEGFQIERVRHPSHPFV